MPKLDFNNFYGVFEDLSNSQRYKIYLLDLQEVYPNQANCYDLQDLDLLAESIKEGGLLSIIEVYQEDNKNILLSGHRRLAACKKIVEEGNRYSFDGEDITGKIPAVIKGKPQNSVKESLHLIQANNQRDLSDEVKRKVIDLLDDLIENNSEDFHLEKGERRALRIAEYTGYSINYVKSYLAERNKALKNGDESSPQEKTEVDHFSKAIKKVAKLDKDIDFLLQQDQLTDNQLELLDNVKPILKKIAKLFERSQY